MPIIRPLYAVVVIGSLTAGIAKAGLAYRDQSAVETRLTSLTTETAAQTDAARRRALGGVVNAQITGGVGTRVALPAHSTTSVLPSADGATVRLIIRVEPMDRPDPVLTLATTLGRTPLPVTLTTHAYPVDDAQVHFGPPAGDAWVNLETARRLTGDGIADGTLTLTRVSRDEASGTFVGHVTSPTRMTTGPFQVQFGLPSATP